jgi:hypothetical protein
MRAIFLTPFALALSGCATTSFAPPQVRMDHEVRATNNQTFFNAICTPSNLNSYPRIDRDTEGALLLISNFVLTYRCQADRAAEGRQFFEVPGFLATAGGAVAAALGAGTNVAIGAGATGAILSQGKSYYAPQDKAVVLNDGVEALLCIQNEAVGIDAYTLKALSNAQAATGVGSAGPPAPTMTGMTDNIKIPAPEGPEIYVSAERQYFEMVRTALIAVERIVAQRLSNSGKPFDTAGVIAELEKAKAEEKEAKEGPAVTAAESKSGTTPTTVAGKDAKEAVASVKEGLTSPGQQQAVARLAVMSNEQVGRTIIKLRALQPKLQQCILRAKI